MLLLNVEQSKTHPERVFVTFYIWTKVKIHNFWQQSITTEYSTFLHKNLPDANCKVKNS